MSRFINDAYPSIYDMLVVQYCKKITKSIPNVTFYVPVIKPVKYLGDFCNPQHVNFQCSNYTEHSECVGGTCKCVSGWLKVDFKTCIKSKYCVFYISNLYLVIQGFIARSIPLSSHDATHTEERGWKVG